MLASAIIEAASKQRGSKVAFVYCENGNPNRDNFLSIARNLLYQLSHNNDVLTAYIDAVMSKKGQMKLQRTGLAKELLRVAVRSHDSVFIVIDGFDECLKQDKKSIFQWVQSIISSDAMPHGGQQGSADQGEHGEPALVRCLIVGQEDGDTSRLLIGYPVLKILPADDAPNIKAGVNPIDPVDLQNLVAWRDEAPLVKNGHPDLLQLPFADPTSEDLPTGFTSISLGL